MLNKEIHEKYMKNLLFAIFTHKISDFLAFKGGTLAYLVYQLNRFSTDIDIDILYIEKEEQIIQGIREILLKYGEIKNETLGKTIHRWIFRYDERNMNIKIELNKRIWQNNQYNHQNIENTHILCMTKECIFANKLVALSERSYSRDLYDVYFFFSQEFPICDAIIYERTGLNTKNFLQKLTKELPKHFTENSVLTGLGEILDDKQKLRVKKSLLKDTIKKIKEYII